jgi:hypothetical protein
MSGQPHMHVLRPTCGKCAYWVEDHTAVPPTAGNCHRFPPGIYIKPDDCVVVQKFPTTDRHQWCGEWCGSDEKLMDAVRSSMLAVMDHEKPEHATHPAASAPHSGQV